ncbi:MAG: bacillithiol biosynthesis cysteine-adding enzyme BshC, partial [Pyrinomonadaceae bacterium]
KVVEECYQPGRKFTDAFAQLVQTLIGDYGLILIDPLDPTLKKLAAPIYKKAIEHAPEIAAALETRSRELQEDGYHAQTLVTSDSFPLFLHIDGKRHALTQTEKGIYRLKHVEESSSGSPTEFDLKTLAQMAHEVPENFSPNVTLRAVVQDFLLPTIAYYGGGAEIAYFAQSSETYRILERPMTTIFHRASMTIVEHSIGRTFERYNLGLVDLFDGMEKVVARVVEEHLDVATSKAFNETSDQIGLALNKLRGSLEEFDPTLAEALESGRRKINYQIDGLRTRFQRALVGRNEAANRQIERAFASLYPNKSLQERQLNVTSLIARHGRYVIDWMYDAIDIETTNKHRLVFL